MATIPQFDAATIPSVYTKLSLTDADTFVFSASKKQVLFLENSGVGALTVTIRGDGVVDPVVISGYGQQDVESLVVTVDAGENKSVLLNNYSAVLAGSVVNVTGTGLSDVSAFVLNV